MKKPERHACRLTTYLLGAWLLLHALPAFAALRAGDIVVNERTIHGEILTLDPLTGTIRHVAAGGSLAFSLGRTVLDGGGDLVVPVGSMLVRVDPSTGAQAIVSSGGLLQSGFAIGIMPGGAFLVGGSPNGTPSILRIDPGTGAQTTVSAGGSLQSIQALGFDSEGELLVACGAVGATPGAILRVDTTSGAQSLAFSGGLIRSPSDFALSPDGSIYLIDSTAHPGACSSGACGEVIRIDPATGQQTLVSSGGQLVNPLGIDIAADGSLVIIDYYVESFIPGTKGPRLLTVDPVTGAQSVLASRFDEYPRDVFVVPGNPVSAPPVCGDGLINQPTEPCDGEEAGVCPGGCLPDCTCFEGLAPGDLVVADPIFDGIFRIDPHTGDRTVLSSNWLGTGASFDFPRGLAVRPDGQILVSDSATGTVVGIDPRTGDRSIVSPSPINVWGDPIYHPVDIELDPLAGIMTIDGGLSAVMRVDGASGERTIVSSTASGIGLGPALGSVQGVAIEPGGQVFVTRFEYPFGGVIAVDPVTGDRTVLSGYAGTANSGPGPILPPPRVLAMGDGGLLYMIGGDSVGGDAMLFRIDAVTGQTTAFSGCFYVPPLSCGRIGQGPDFVDPRGVAIRTGEGIFVADVSLDAVLGVDAVTGDRSVLSAAGAGGGIELLGPWAIAVVPANLDTDSDGLPDDGDGSGTVGDHPCATAQVSGCDDNCRFAANPGQNDLDGDAQGDACDADDDNDALADAVETNTGEFLSASDTGTSPLNADSDGDGFTDGAEVAAGSDPNEPGSLPPGGAIPTLGTTGAFVLALALLAAGGRALRRDPAGRPLRGWDRSREK